MKAVKYFIERLLPPRWRTALRKHITRKIYLISLTGRRLFCPLCEQGYRKFGTVGVVPRPNAQCPNCHSLERHRALWLALQFMAAEGRLQTSGTLLHVAPEDTLATKFRQNFDYTSIDIDGSHAMCAMDITNLSFTDESFDVIICNHVLEHVGEDNIAIAELHRVLKSSGWASIQVPMKGLVTQEDLSITDPQERIRLYGQEDHVRQYGADYPLRLQQAGFTLLLIDLRKMLSAEDLTKFAVAREPEILLVTKNE